MVDAINPPTKRPPKPPTRTRPTQAAAPQRLTAGREAELREAIEQFFFAYRAFTSRPDRILARRGLGRVHHRILYFVGRQPDITVSALLATLAVSKQALNAPLRRLVQTGLVSARAGDHDRRIKQLRLSAEGVRLEAQLTGTQMQQLASVFGSFAGNAEPRWLAVMRTIAGSAD